MTARLMQLCCEGHNERFQNYYREQPMYSGGSLDLLSAVNDLLVVLCETSIVVASSSAGASSSSADSTKKSSTRSASSVASLTT